MKQIIEGRIYNTETARKIAHTAEGSSTDFKACSETLYKTPKGTYFLAGSGGPLTHWATPVVGGGVSGGSGIKPLNSEEALAWMEKHGIETATIEAEFGAMLKEA